MSVHSEGVLLPIFSSLCSLLCCWGGVLSVCLSVCLWNAYLTNLLIPLVNGPGKSGAEFSAIWKKDTFNINKSWINRWPALRCSQWGGGVQTVSLQPELNMSSSTSSDKLQHYFTVLDWHRHPWMSGLLISVVITTVMESLPIKQFVFKEKHKVRFVSAMLYIEMNYRAFILKSSAEQTSEKAHKLCM